jgi:hypothetical protein
MTKWVIVVSVLIVLGIVGATIMSRGEAVEAPKYSKMLDVAKASSVWSDLRLMREVIERYRDQHNGHLPGVVGTANFKQALTVRTDGFGNAGSDYGPYLQKIPKNAFNGLDTVNVSGMGVIGDDSHGWEFNPKTGCFHADDSAEHER